MKTHTDSKKIMHAGFEISLLIKGIDGILETGGGILFLFISPERLNSLVQFLTQREISEDPNDLVSNLLINMSQGFSVSLQTFVAIYLMTHGMSKVLLVYLLQMKKIWAYPLSIGFLMLFIGYQIHRYLYSHSILMIFLTLFDLVMIWLVLVEYKRVKEMVQKKKRVG